MRLVVAGATGRIGRILGRVWGAEASEAPEAPEARGGLEVTFTGRRAEGPVGPGAVGCRMTEPEGFARLLSGADVVLDLAGPTRAPGTDQHQEHLRLFEAMAALAPCPIVTMSTSAVYGRGAMRTEDSVAQPEGGYGKAKLEVEARVRETEGAVALRLGNVAGADALLGGAVPGRVVELTRFPDGATPRRSYLGPVTLARVLAELCERAAQGALPKVLNLCGPRPVEMADLLDTAELPWRAIPAPETALRELTLSPERLREYVDLPEDAGDPEVLIREWRRVAS